MVTFLISIVPSAGALFLFWLALRAILQADRRERSAVARYDSEHGRRVPAASDAAAGDAEAVAADHDTGADDAADEAAADAADAADAGSLRRP